MSGLRGAARGRKDGTPPQVLRGIEAFLERSQGEPRQARRRVQPVAHMHVLSCRLRVCGALVAHYWSF